MEEGRGTRGEEVDVGAGVAVGVAAAVDVVPCEGVARLR